jgi:hypothetical protein
MQLFGKYCIFRAFGLRVIPDKHEIANMQMVKKKQHFRTVAASKLRVNEI